jgi:hypothetical protein
LGDREIRGRFVTEQDKRLEDIRVGIAALSEHLSNQDRVLSKLEAAVNGNGKPGLLVRVDRLEQQGASDRWARRRVAAAAIGAAFAAVAGWFGHRN